MNEDQINHKSKDRFINDDDVFMHTSHSNGRNHDSKPIFDTTCTTTTSTTTTTTATQCVRIENRQTIYIPIQLDCGITVMCHPDIFNPRQQCFHHIRTILQTDVSYCLQILPGSVRSLVRRTNIWLNVQNYCYSYDPQTKQPIYVNHITTHHHVAWLLWYVSRLCFNIFSTVRKFSF